jgi:hypothetical protein
MGNELAAWGVEALTFNTLGGPPGEPFFEHERLRPADVDRLAKELPGLRVRLAERGLWVYGSGHYVQRLGATARGQALPGEDCGPGEQALFVDEHGRAGTCSFTASSHGVPIAEVRTGAAVAALPARLRANLRRRPATACNDCQSTQVFGKFARTAT